MVNETIINVVVPATNGVFDSLVVMDLIFIALVAGIVIIGTTAMATKSKVAENALQSKIEEHMNAVAVQKTTAEQELEAKILAASTKVAQNR